MARLIADAGLLVAADRNDRAVWALKKVTANDDVELVVPAPALAQVWRGPGSANLARFMRGVEVIVLDEHLAKVTGALLGASGTSDVCDAAVAACARDGDRVATGDVGHLSRLIALRGVRAAVLGV